MKWEYDKTKIFCIDNGAYSIKYSTAHRDSEIKSLHNCVFTDKNNYNSSMIQPKINVISGSDNFILDDVNKNKESFISMMRNYNRPMSRGLLSDIDLEIEIWKKMFYEIEKQDKIKNNLKESICMFSHTPMTPDKVMEGYFQMIFDYFEFDSLFKAIPHYYSAISASNSIPNLNDKVQLVIDSGFSSTTIVPILNSKPVYNAIKRIDIGGKLLTNYLKDAIDSQCDLDIRKDFYLVNLIKEELCFLSKNFNSDLVISSLTGENNINKKEFILPEYRSKNPEQLLKINKDRYTIPINSLRFVVPELLFSPSLIEIDQGGLLDGIFQSIKGCHSDYKNLLYENIVLTGGNFNFPNIKERLNYEIIPNSDYDSDINIYKYDEYIVKEGMTYRSKQKYNDYLNTSVIEGMKLISNNIELMKENSISKKEYDEIGFNVFWKTQI